MTTMTRATARRDVLRALRKDPRRRDPAFVRRAAEALLHRSMPKEEPPARSTIVAKDRTLYIRLTVEEYARIARISSRNDDTVSAWCRRVLRRAVREGDVDGAA